MSFSFVYESWYRCLTCAGVCGITVSRINMKRFGTDSLKFPVHPKVSLNGSVNIQKLMNTYQMSSLPWRWFRQRQFERARAHVPRTWACQHALMIPFDSTDNLIRCQSIHLSYRVNPTDK